MNGIIRLLPDSVANQIAAGEVIQRPASVVKELVENAIDADALHIEVRVTDAGKTSIQVIDDGKGMSETDARLAFERHATSKIQEAADLFALHTLGFRGEALASIAAVAQVELRTRPEGEDLGTLLSIAGSKIEGQEVVSCPKGSNIHVKNLFFNVPVRRKFLKTNQTELSNVLAELERIVLVNPDVSFTLFHHNAELLNLPACPLRQRIMGVFGKKINQELLSLDVHTTMVHLSGFVGKPDTARRKGARQYFFVNGRYMRHPYFHKAVMDAYEHLVPVGEQVSYFLYFDVKPEDIDVNIHPSKTEIKFENESAIWQILAAAVKETLGRFNAVPSIDFDTEGMPDIPAFESSPYSVVSPPKPVYNPDYNPFHSSASSSSAREWKQLYAGLEHSATPSSDPYPEGSEGEPTGIAEATGLYENAGGGVAARYYQFKGRFILTSVQAGLMIIDQHRAHICILYDKYMGQIAGRQGVSQGMLFPDMVSFPPSDVPLLQEIKDDMSFLGFELADLGGGSYAINGIPAGTEGLNPVELVRNLVSTAREKSGKVKEEVQGMLALALAKAVAIVPGQVLTNEEMAALADGLFALPAPNYTPDGKKVLSVLAGEELEKLFR